METTGKCIICGFRGEAERDFICENCGDPEKIIFTCLNCGNRIDLTQTDPERLEKFLDQKIDKGSAIASPFCPECVSEDMKPRRVIVYRVQPWGAGEQPPQRIRFREDLEVIRIDPGNILEGKEIIRSNCSENEVEEFSALLENAPLLAELSLGEIAERVRRAARKQALEIEDVWAEGNALRFLIKGGIYEVHGGYLRGLSRRRYTES